MPIPRKNITDSCTIPRECNERFLPLEEPHAEPLTSRGINFAGISDLVEPYQIVRGSPSFHLVIVTLGGTGLTFLDGDLRSDGEGRELHPGDLWIAPANGLQAYRAHGNWRILFFHIDARHCSGTIPYDGPMVGHSTYAVQMESAMTWFINESLANSVISKQTARAYAEVIRNCFDRDIDALANPEERRVREQLDGLWEAVNSNLSNDWSVAEMARRMRLSTTQFRRVVNQQYGATPQQIVMRLRMGRTKELLRRTNYSLEQIAEQVGYDSPFSLSRAFKNSTGRSPRDFRKSTYPK